MFMYVSAGTYVLWSSVGVRGQPRVLGVTFYLSYLSQYLVYCYGHQTTWPTSFWDFPVSSLIGVLKSQA